MDSTKIPGNEFLDILFYGRNKDYGAYELRSRYDRRVRNAVIGTASIMLVLIGGYVLNNTLMAADNSHRPVFAEKKIELDNVRLPDPDPVIPPPPVEQHTPPPAASTVDFATPVITDKPVSPDEMPPRQEDIGNKAIGFENTAGADDGIDPGLDPRGAGNGVVKAPVAEVNDNRPFTVVEFMPEFPGGEAALRKYLSNNIRYPHMAQENEIQGIVSIQFVVNRDGSISDVKVISAAKGGGLEEEALRVVSKMPKWRPGRQNGQNVPVFFNLPINFALTPQ